MIRERYNYKDFKSKILQLNQVGAYPFNHFATEDYATFIYRFLNALVNTKSLLLLMVFIKSKFSRQAD